MKSLEKNLDLSSLEFKRNAHQIYKDLREHDPVHEITMPTGQKTWLITRYSDAVEALKDDERLTKRVYSLYPEKFASLLPEKELNLVGGHMLYNDPPNHTRLRSIAQKAFTPKVIKGMSDEIQRITDDLLDTIQERGRMEVMKDFAFPIPVTVISSMLGIPKEDHSLIKKWSDAYMTASNNYNNLKKIYPELHAFRLYLEDLIDDRKKNPKSDLTSLLVQASYNGEKFTVDELVCTIFVTIVGGHETTASLLGNGLLALLENPDQFNLLKNNPTVATTAIDEFLRYYSPMELATTRVASQDFTWHGKNITKGDHIFVGLAAANRDPEKFDNPDQLDITRKKNRHIAFSQGVHFCMGSQLARLEAKIAFTSLLQRFPDIQVDGTLEDLNWQHGTVSARGLERFPVLV